MTTETENSPEKEAAAEGIVHEYLTISDKLAAGSLEHGEISLALKKGEIDDDKAAPLYRDHDKKFDVLALAKERDEVLKKLSELFGEEGAIMRPDTLKFFKEREATLLSAESTEFPNVVLEELAKAIGKLEKEHYKTDKGFKHRRELKEAAFGKGTIPEELTTAIEELKEKAMAKGVDEAKIDTVIEIRARNVMTGFAGE